MNEKYIGRMVDLIYVDRHGAFTKRKVHVLGIRGDKVKVYCCERQAYRILKIDSILAVQLAANAS